jgi:hypothetical protein
MDVIAFREAVCFCNSNKIFKVDLGKIVEEMTLIYMYTSFIWKIFSDIKWTIKKLVRITEIV